MINIIREQQELAQEIINAIYKTFNTKKYTAVVAGGAARDWFLGNVINDIDIFICNVPADEPLFIEMFITLLNLECGYNFVKLQKNKLHKKYALTKCEGVYESVINGQKIQLCFSSLRSINTVITDFVVSISEIYWHNNTFYYTQLFDLSVKNKVLIQTKSKEEAEDSYRYINKIRERFSDYAFYETFELYNTCQLIKATRE